MTVSVSAVLVRFWAGFFCHYSNGVLRFRCIIILSEGYELAAIISRTRKDGTTAYRVQIVIKKHGEVIHREGETFPPSRSRPQLGYSALLCVVWQS